jgi:hypothetical protein
MLNVYFVTEIPDLEYWLGQEKGTSNGNHLISLFTELIVALDDYGAKTNAPSYVDGLVRICTPKDLEILALLWSQEIVEPQSLVPSIAALKTFLQEYTEDMAFRYLDATYLIKELDSVLYAVEYLVSAGAKEIRMQVA